MRHLTASLLTLLVASLTLAACAAHIYSDAEVTGLPRLDAVMWAQAQATDQTLRLIDAAELTDADYAAIQRAGERLRLSAPRLKTDFSKGPEWDALALDLAARADELVTAASQHDGTRGRVALSAMRDACRACHKKFR